MISREDMDDCVVAQGRAGRPGIDLFSSIDPPILDARMLQSFLGKLERRLKRDYSAVVDLLGAPSSDFDDLVGKRYLDVAKWAFGRQ